MTEVHEPLPWQTCDWERIAPALSGGRLTHAVLFTGAPGIGKRHFAGVIAQALLCESTLPDGRPCGRCRSCVQWAAGTHPDSAQLAPDASDKPIKVDAARGFTDALHLTPQYGHGRVGLIDPADGMNLAAANSLLKVLEEPPAGSHLLLVTDRPRAVLPTIQSRCQRFRLSRAGGESMSGWLARAPEDTAALLPLVRGAPLRAARLAEAGVAQTQTQWLQALVALTAGKQDPVAVVDDWHDDQPDALLDWLYLVCLDVVKIGAGANHHTLLFQSEAQAIDRIAAAVDVRALQRVVPNIVRARRSCGTSVDFRLGLESLCVQLLECRRRVGGRGRGAAA